MLQFILGKPASGKTYTVLNKLKELSAEGKTAVLIVPEQFTFESERGVLKTLGDKAALNVAVLSFTRLCDEVGSIAGGIAGKVLGDADKVIFMHRALSAVENDLKLWGRYTANVSFSGTVLDTVGEFKINAISPDGIRKTAENVTSASLKAKLHDIALIYETYDMLTGERFIDPADKLTKLYRDLEQNEFFKGKTVILDSFKGFTGQQFRIIERIFAQADDVYVSLTDDPTVTKEYSVYTNIRTAAERIKKIAKNHGVETAEPIVLGESRYTSENLVSVERLLAVGETEKAENDGSVNICFAATVFDEAEFTARTIRRLVRTKGYRYRDFVVIARDAEAYEEAVTSACKRNRISCFYDKRMPLADFPMSTAASCAIKALKLSTESILRFHKTGLGTLNNDEISRLENYTYLWNIDGSTWLKKWDMDVRGFVSDGEDKPEIHESLKEINALREKALAPLLEFKDNFAGNAPNMAAAIVKLFKACNVGEKLSLMCDRAELENLPFSGDALKQAYDEYMNILDSLVNSFGVAGLDTVHFTEALDIAVSKASVGVIPQCLDEVTFGAADRIRPSRPKIAFIIGANQGVFPRLVGNSGVFNIIERKSLIENGMNIADNSVYSSIDEEYLVYCNLCCATDRLYITCKSQSLSGEKSEASPFVDTLCDKLDCNILYEPQLQLNTDNAPETDLAAFTEFCRRIRTSPGDALSVKYALKNGEQAEKTEFINSFIEGNKKELQPDTAKQLFGSNIYMSATKFDTFNRCRFSFFCRYGLKAQKLQPADFDVLQRGTIVHYVLERFISGYKKGVAELSDSEIDSITDKFIEDYLDSVVGFRSVETARTRFLISRVSRSLKEVVRHMAKDFRQTDFEPVACELKIGGDGIPLEFGFDGGKVRINGSIDRVDEYNGYVRIIDYKTGSKAFKLPDILFGLNLQMLLYLYAVIRGQNLPDSKAAGILYMPSRRDTNDKGMAMNGLITSDSEIVRAMDKELDGEFVPKLKLNKDGTLSKRNNSFIDSERFGEIFDYIEKLMEKTGKSVLSGDIEVSPVDGRESKACAYCDFATVCGIEDSEAFRVPDLNNDAVFEAMKGGDAVGD